MPAIALLAGWLIALLIVGWPMLIGLPIIIFSIYIIVSIVPE